MGGREDAVIAYSFEGGTLTGSLRRRSYAFTILVEDRDASASLHS
jgi:hypothetical protein